MPEVMSRMADLHIDIQEAIETELRALGIGCDWRDVGFCIWEVSEYLDTPPEEVLQVFFDMVKTGYAEASSLMESDNDE